MATLLRPATSETSRGTPRELLETRCRALQVLLGRLTADFGFEFGADFGVDFWCGFRRGFSNWVREVLVRFFWCKGAKPQNCEFPTNFRTEIQTNI